MDNQLPQENAVAAIRVSSLKQGLQGDSPEAQKEQIDLYVKTRNICIKKYFVFMESASHEEQPVQEAIDYCKNPKNKIDKFIIKSIDRFTRGGSYFYDSLKMQLTKNGVRLVDLYGIIGAQDVNTLEHLGVEYDWSVYSPTKKSEILEAERAKDEMRDIMSRMIGAEIRYVRLGYRVRKAPYGYMNEKTETMHGRRIILVPDPEEAPFISKMYEQRIEGSKSDEEIVKAINEMGFKSRKRLVRNPKNRSQILRETGGNELTVKQFQKYIKNPLYAGVNQEKWTQGEAIKCKFDGLVTMDDYNKANKDKMTIIESSGKVMVLRDKPKEVRQVINPEYPYKKHVLCPFCRKTLLGSASRGKLGKHYPAYHCAKRGHYFRVPVGEFEETIKNFVRDLRFTKEDIENLKKSAIEEWNRRIASNQKDYSSLGMKIAELETRSEMVAKKIPDLTSPVALKYVESQLDELKAQIVKLEKTKTEKTMNVISMEMVLEDVSEYLEHLDILLFGGSNTLKSAEYFSLLFDEIPTYEELKAGTPKLAPYIKLIRDLHNQKSPYARPKGVEPPTA